MKDKEKKAKNAVVGRRGCWLIALYPVVSSFLLMLAYVLWSEGCSEMGYPMSWSVRWQDLAWAFLSVIGVFPSLWVMRKAKEVSSVKKESPILFIAANFCIALLSPVLIPYAVIGNSVGVGGMPLFFGFIIGMIVAFSTFLHIKIREWMEFPDELESLKLRHDWIWKLINTITMISTILVVSAYYVLYTNSIAFIPLELQWMSSSFGKLGLAFSIPGVFLLVGLFFGILSPLFGFAFTIPNKVAVLERADAQRIQNKDMVT